MKLSRSEWLCCYLLIYYYTTIFSTVWYSRYHPYSDNLDASTSTHLFVYALKAHVNIDPPITEPNVVGRAKVPMYFDKAVKLFTTSFDRLTLGHNLHHDLFHKIDWTNVESVDAVNACGFKFFDEYTAPCIELDEGFVETAPVFLNITHPDSLNELGLMLIKIYRKMKLFHVILTFVRVQPVLHQPMIVSLARKKVCATESDDERRFYQRKSLWEKCLLHDFS